MLIQKKLKRSPKVFVTQWVLIITQLRMLFGFSDNGRDMMGDDMPPCEINRVGEGEEGRALWLSLMCMQGPF